MDVRKPNPCRKDAHSLASKPALATSTDYSSQPSRWQIKKARPSQSRKSRAIANIRMTALTISEGRYNLR
jgi:hypothetical protein